MGCVVGGRTVIILQARLASSRLPAKALASVGGASILKRCLHRLWKSGVGPVLLATTERPEDDSLVVVARRLGVDVYRGPTDDVLTRFVGAAQRAGAEIIVRATADNPAVDIGAPGRVVRALCEARSDYSCEEGLPCGAGVEAITAASLIRASALATLAEDREHVTTYLKRHPQLFRLERRLAPPGLSRGDLRLTIDTEADLRFMRQLFSAVRTAEPSLAQLIAAAT